MEEVIVITTENLITLNEDAIRRDFNRALQRTVYDMLDPMGVHVVVFSMVHNDTEMRVIIHSKFCDVEAPTTLILDMTFENFERLARVTNVEGKWVRV